MRSEVLSDSGDVILSPGDLGRCNPNPVALDYFVERLEPRWADGLCTNGHEWVVYSTALREGWLMVQCVECGAMGTIDDPSPEEKSEAFYAPSRPYRWQDNTRVTERGYASPRVVRSLHGSQCECPSQRSLTNSKGYERIPGGIGEHSGRLGDEGKAELIEFADFVGESNLCSRLMPTFIRSFETDAGHRFHHGIHTIVGRIEEFDDIGLHCSPAAIAWIIRVFATWETREQSVIAALAEKVADKIVGGGAAFWLRWFQHGRVRVVVSRLFPVPAKDNLIIRRRTKRFQEALVVRLAQKGWVPTGWNTFRRTTLPGANP